MKKPLMNAVTALYIHFPFCRRICPFCSFAVLQDRPGRHDIYCGLLDSELSILSRQHHFDFRSLASVYCGGGTPSRLSIDELVRVTDWLRAAIPSAETAMWTIEVNPEDMTRAFGKTLKRIGIARVSLGTQSFSAAGLATLRREHQAEDNYRAIEILQSAGITDWNLDLMFGYPGQTLADLDDDLRKAFRCGPRHISVYGLQIEEKTAVYRRPDWLRWQRENEVLLAQMFRQVMIQLPAYGYQQYEISNFARPGWESLHNQLVWGGNPYLGLGLGAHSFIGSRRWGNHRRWKAYRLALEAGQAPQAFSEIIDAGRRVDEELMIRIRLSEGLDLRLFAERYGLVFSENWRRKLAELVDNGWVFPDNNRLRLTIEGMLLADEITGSLAALL
jgi:oxygen-independent coproporphyrinogen III oxidase